MDPCAFSSTHDVHDVLDVFDRSVACGAWIAITSSICLQTTAPLWRSTSSFYRGAMDAASVLGLVGQGAAAAAVEVASLQVSAHAKIRNGSEFAYRIPYPHPHHHSSAHAKLWRRRIIDLTPRLDTVTASALLPRVCPCEARRDELRQSKRGATRDLRRLTRLYVKTGYWDAGILRCVSVCVCVCVCHAFVRMCACMCMYVCVRVCVYVCVCTVRQSPPAV